MVLGKLKKKRDTHYYFFSGKGGVGKTSMAAATALWFSKNKKTLIISTDPAHSLSDSFELSIGSEPKKLTKNLWAVEIDPAKTVEEYTKRISPHVDKIAFLKDFGLDETFDIAGMTPGIDEISAFDKFMQYMNSNDYDIIIFDTAPTGHALRFLSLPDVLDSWIGKMIKVRMKFAGVAHVVKKLLPFSESEEEPIGTDQLEEMKERIQQAKSILTNPGKTNFWVVVIPEQMSILESERALKSLKSYGIAVNGIIVNQLIPENHCSFCSARRQMQEKNLKKLRSVFASIQIKHVPLFAHEIKGFATLEKIAMLLLGKH